MTRHTQSISGLLVLGALLANSGVLHAQDSRERAIFVEAVNERPGFGVRVAVDRKDRTYHVGDLVTVTVTSEKKGFLYLLYLQADGQQVLLFPNRHHKFNQIPAKRAITVPAPDGTFRLRVGAPTGKELLKAIVTEAPIRADEIEEAKTKDFLQIKSSRTRAIFVEAVRRQNQSQGQAQEGQRLAEHHIEITTLPKGQSIVQREVRRIAVCIGISDFKDDRIRDLKICHKDAEKFAQMLQKHCGFQQVILLTNAEATGSAIQKAIRKTLVDRTQPGDEIIIYWSGHGTRMADENGDEPDGKDELLVPHDAKVGNIDDIKDSMISDDQFGRWILGLDGRRILVVLDTCHSGGQATGQKGLLLPGDDPADVPENTGFFDREFSRAKDIGQRGAALLASSMARQVSFERFEGDLSVMTYFIIEFIGRNNQVTLGQLGTYLKRAVPKYVQDRQPGTTQTPVLIDDVVPMFVLNP